MLLSHPFLALVVEVQRLLHIAVKAVVDPKSVILHWALEWPLVVGKQNISSGHFLCSFSGY